MLVDDHFVNKTLYNQCLGIKPRKNDIPALTPIPVLFFIIQEQPLTRRAVNSDGTV